MHPFSASGVAGAPRYGVVVPVKRPLLAKSRLAAVGDDTRRDLVVAFAMDTLSAALRSPLVARVLVVTDDALLVTSCRELGVLTSPDRGLGDLNRTLSLGAADVLREHEGLRPVALCADLPALRSAELTSVLESAPGDRAGFVADTAGTGTTLYTAPTLGLFRPAFGAGSCRAHLDAGATELGSAGVPSLRRDVDTPEDLRDALRLGVGVRTADVAVAAGLGLTS